MKKLFSVTTLLSIALFTLTFASCKKKSDSNPSSGYSCAACTTAPDAKAANDNSSKGIYKGIIVGSSGTVKFDIMNSDSTIKAYITIDGVSATLTANVAWRTGAAYVSPFTGTFNGSPISITFSIDQDGSNPSVTAMDIPGHPNASFTIAKETSAGLLKCFEGTYKNNTTGEKGTFDLFVSGSLKKWSAKSRPDGATQSNTIEGAFDGTKLSFDDGKGTTVSGTLSGDNVSGTFTGSKPENGTWEGKRTL